jgi:hypothetical protein
VSGAVKRKRCPFCLRLEVDVKRHIEEWHFPRHCSECLRTMISHPKTQTSPQDYIPCTGAFFTI